MPLKLAKHILAAVSGRELLCGFSGGADSSALLLLLKKSIDSGQGGFSLKAVHFEHGIRGEESLRDAAFCESFCAKLGVPFLLIKLSVPQSLLPGEGFEAAARRLRIDHWRKLAASPSSAVALGHNADDRAENLFLRLFRGSNATGLSSMRAVQKLDGILFVRPLLETRRSEIEAFLREAGFDSWRNDSTNSDEAYKRNFIRHSLMPAIAGSFPYAVDGIAHSLKALQDDAAFLEEAAAWRWEALKKLPRISAADWMALPLALRIRVLRLWLTASLGCDFVPDSKLIERFNDAIFSAGSEPELLPLKDGCGFITVSSSIVALARQEPLASVLWNWRSEPSVAWGDFSFNAQLLEAKELPQDNWTAFFKPEALPPALELGRWLEGERMTPIGHGSTVKLKELFNKAGVSSLARETHPVLRLPSGEPLWVPGVKRSDLAPWTPGSMALAISAKRA